MVGHNDKRQGVARYILAIGLVLLFLLAPSAPFLVLGDTQRGQDNNVDSEPNNTLVEATEIDSALNSINGSLGPTDYDDFYKIRLNFDDIGSMADRLSVIVHFDSQSSEPMASILDPWGFVLDHGTGTDISIQVTSASDLWGLFYIHLNALIGNSGYAMDTIVSNEPVTDQDSNNKPGSAQIIGPLNPFTAKGDLWGGQGHTDYQDFYKVRLEATGPLDPGFISLHLDVGSDAMFKLEIYDEYLSILSGSVDISDPDPGEDAVLSYLGGTSMDIYVRVWAANGFGEYNLTAYVLTLSNIKDGDLAHASLVPFNGPNRHIGQLSGSVGHNSYPGPSDDSDLWKIEVKQGQTIRGTATSIHYNDLTKLPLMQVKAFDNDGGIHTFSGPNESYDGIVDPVGGFQLVAVQDGFIYLQVDLMGEGSGGGGYVIDLFSNRPPQILEDAPIDATVLDEGTTSLTNFEQVFSDLEGDILQYSVSVGDPHDLGFGSSVKVAVLDNGSMMITPEPRYEGSGTLTLTARERDYGGSKQHHMNVSVDPCGCHDVMLKEPYDRTLSLEGPIVLVYDDHMIDDSIDLSDIFYDPLDGTLDWTIKGDHVSYKDGIWDVGGIFKIGPVPPAQSGMFTPLPIRVIPSMDANLEHLIPIKLQAFPIASGPIEASEPVEVILKLIRGNGAPPVWTLPDALETLEDTALTIDLDDYTADPDPVDLGALEYSLTDPGYDVISKRLDRSIFKLEPRKDWCGVEEDMVLKVTDTFGWTAERPINLLVDCVADGPKILMASPPTAQVIVIFEGEEIAFTVIVADVDTGGKDLVYDWYINGYPEIANGEPTFIWKTSENTAGGFNVTVEVSNGATGLRTSARWNVTVEHINQPPIGWIGVTGIKDGANIYLDVFEEAEFVGNAKDPERSDLGYLWNFGDGAVGNSRVARHGYSDPGRYVVTLIVSDGEFSTYSHINVTVKASTTLVPTPRSIGLDVGLWFAAIVLLVAAVGIGSTEPSKYKIILLMTVLYSKIKKTKVLDHYIRGRIQGYITANPGAHYNMIKMDLSINNGNLAYHLKVLEGQGFIKSVRDGIYKRFYPNTMRIARPPSIQERILVLLRNHPGLSQKEIAKKLDKSPSTINDYIRRMAIARLLRIERVGVRNHCYVLDH